jgi:hypothetical protein
MKLLTLLALAYSVCAADDAPPWVRDAGSAIIGQYPPTVPAVVLLNEQHLSIDDSGKRVCTTRRAIRILLREGRKMAMATEEYLTNAGKVRDLKAWLISPAREVKRYGKDRVIDMALSPNDVYNDYRMRVIDAESDAAPGMTFVSEAVSEDRSIFTQWLYPFQNRLPTLVSRFILSMPPEWRAQTVTFNAEQVKAVSSAGSYVWELRDLPFLEPEPASPGVSGLIPRLGISFFPATGARNAGPSFATWKDVSRFQWDLAETQQKTSDALVGKARSLAASAKGDFERIAAVGRHVQSLNYIAIQTSVGRGGGYRPHSAADVFEKSYGDCKDKANLMRTMLKQIGIDSFLVAIYSGDRTHVREQWPSPWQFNHMIIAVKLSDPVKAPAVLEHPHFGRLLIFDPTDDTTPPGYLPDPEQGSLALLIAGSDGELVRMPATPPSFNRTERETEVSLSAAGTVAVIVSERYAGESAIKARRSFLRRSRPDYWRDVEHWVAETATGAKIPAIDPHDSSNSAEFGVGIQFEAPFYAQVMQGRLMMFRPAVLAHGSYLFPSEKRAHPVVLDSESFSETVRTRLPEGFEVDEIPSNAKLDTQFGAYECSYTVKDGVLVFRQSLEVQPAVVPASEYGGMREFFGRVIGARRQPVVLVKK